MLGICFFIRDAECPEEPNRVREKGVAIEDKLIDRMLANYRKPEDLTGPEGLFTELKKRLINRVLESELPINIPALECG